MKMNMNLSALYHRAKSGYCFVDQDRFVLRLRTASGNIDSAELVCYDRFSPEETKNIVAMPVLLRDELYTYYECEVPLRSVNKRLGYYFKLNKGSRSILYTEEGLKEEYVRGNFAYPYANAADCHRIPDWVSNRICYQIFPDRFRNGNPERNPAGTSPWGTAPVPGEDQFMGGDLPGIISRLDYLKDLGINFIYLTPLFRAHSYHKYDTIDYFEIDPAFGTDEDFKTLVAQAHRRGMKVMLDAVFNHTGHHFPFFRDTLERGKKSPYYHWFHMNEDLRYPVDFDALIRSRTGSPEGTPPASSGSPFPPVPYETFANTLFMPKLNTENPETKEYLLRAGEYWVKEFDIDGWRLDVANEIDHVFWREFRRRIRNIKKEVVIIGEIWHNPEPWLRGDQHDSVMNYGLQTDIRGLFAEENIDVGEFRKRFNSRYVEYSNQVNAAMLNLLDSHDTARYITECGGDRTKALLSFTVLMTVPGIPMIYYGTEIEMTGENDPFCRKCMEWERVDEAKDLLFPRTIRRLIQIRTEETALQKGSMHWLDFHKDILGYVRSVPGEPPLRILVNGSGQDIPLSAPELLQTKDLLTETPFNGTAASRRAYILK